MSTKHFHVQLRSFLSLSEDGARAIAAHGPQVAWQTTLVWTTHPPDMARLPMREAIAMVAILHDFVTSKVALSTPVFMTVVEVP